MAILHQARSHAEQRAVALERALAKELADRTTVDRRADATLEAREAAEGPTPVSPRPTPVSPRPTRVSPA